MYRVLVDFHHASLLRSMILLFEQRLGGFAYRPIGLDWHRNGFWHVYDHPATVEQFLQVGGNSPDGTRKINEVAGESAPGVYLCHDIDSDTFNRAITFDEFIKTKFDYVIATIPQHVEPFKRLVRGHQPQAKFIYQIGNAWDIQADTSPNVMASAIVSNVPDGVNFITYHQEFDTSIFKPQQTSNQKLICSFMNVYNGQPHFEKDWLLFQRLETQMDDWVWRSYGGSCRDGAMHGTRALSAKMAECRFGWHVKNGGDGYGHVIHNLYAMGIPPIVKMQHYQNKLAGLLMEDGETCIAIDGLSESQIITKILHYNESERYETMRRNVYNRFSQIVDFDNEALNIAEFLKRCI